MRMRGRGSRTWLEDVARGRGSRTWLEDVARGRGSRTRLEDVARGLRGSAGFTVVETATRSFGRGSSSNPWNVASCSGIR